MANTDFGEQGYQYEWQNPNRKTFDFGRVLGRAFTGVFSSLKPLAVAVAIVLTLTIVLNILSSQQLRTLMGDGSPEAVLAATQTPGYWIWSLLSSIPVLFFTLWVQLIVVKTSYAVFTDSLQLASPLIAAFRFLLPMSVIAVIYVIVCYLGMIPILIGFVFVWPGWALAGPILVHENHGLFGSIGEAWNLSKGNKRWIFLLLVLLSIISAIIYTVAMGAGMVLTGINAFGGDTAATLNMSIGQQVTYNIVFGITSYFSYALFASALTAAYVEIKIMKGGLGTVGEVFS